MSREQQLRYLAQSIRLREAASPRLVRMTTMATSLSILAFLVWAAVTDVHEIAHTPGEIVPSGLQQTVQHLEGGIVKEILAQEGETVQEGQVLVRLDGAGAEEDLKRAREKAMTLALREERLRAFVENRAPQFPSGARPELLRDQEAFFGAMQDAREKDASVVREQIAQKEKAISGLESDLATARKNFAIADNLYKKRKELSARGLVPETRMLEAAQAYNQIDGQVRNLGSQIEAARSSIEEYKNRLASLSAGGLNDASKEIDGIVAARAENDEQIKKLEDRVARLDVRAPVRGIVKGITVNTIGGVVQPGQGLMEIIPLDKPLIVSLKVQPGNIGHIHEGQDVRVKFSAFDFSRYGSVPGKLEFISASTFNADNGERYYQGRVKLARAFVGEDPRNAVMPGMTVMADVVTGDKTVLEYLLKPIRNAMSTAFTER